MPYPGQRLTQPNRINWRNLLTELGVPFRDRGTNCSAGNIVIPCCWCGDDPSMHLRIREADGAYFCLRDRRHGGKSPDWLVRKLTGSKTSAQTAIEDNRSDTKLHTPDRPENKSFDEMEREWSRFLPAAESDECLDYLEERGFTNPIHLTQKLDLRYARDGRWARRILFPMRDINERVGAWTGRSMRKSDQLRYFTQPYDAQKRALFCGEFTGPNIVLVEGPIDAAKINAVGIPHHTAISLCTGSVDGPRTIAIRKLNPSRLIVSLDNGVKVSTWHDTIALLKSVLTTNGVRIKYLRTPQGVKDPGAMSEQQIRNWLKTEG